MKNEALKSPKTFWRVSLPLFLGIALPFASYAETIATDGTDDPAERLAAVVFSVVAGLIGGTVLRILK